MFVCVALVCLAHNAQAKPEYFFSLGMSGTRTFLPSGNTGSIATPLSLGFYDDIGGKWAWYSGLGITLSSVPLEPLVFTGPIYNIDDRWLVGLDVFYQITPPSGSHPFGQQVGGEVYVLAEIGERTEVGVAVSVGTGNGLALSVTPFAEWRIGH